MLRLVPVIIWIGIDLTSCTRNQKKMAEPMPRAKATQEPSEIDVPLAQVAPTSAVTEVAPTEVVAQPVTTTQPEVKCESFGKLPSPPPVAVGNPTFVVTRVLKKCTTSDGKDGYEPNSPYLAMGFPCTGGGGEVTVKGNTYDPKMVAFRVGIACPMLPKDSATIAATLKKEYDVFADSKLAAYTPFEIQYWEMDAYSDADVGSMVEFRNPESLKKGWESFQKREPIQVRLIGRESSWLKGGQYLQAEARIVSDNVKRFRLEVSSVKALSDTEYQAAKQKCQALQPRRDCSEAFSE